MLKQNNFTYYLKTNFCSLHTEATLSGLRENVKLKKNIYMVPTKDGGTEMCMGIRGVRGV